MIGAKCDADNAGKLHLPRNTSAIQLTLVTFSRNHLSKGRFFAKNVRFYKENAHILNEDGLFPPKYDTFVSGNCEYLIKFAKT